MSTRGVGVKPLDYQTALDGNQRFKLLKRLGQGGMATVYAAYDRELESEVALKTITNQTADSILMFKNEFRALQDIHHPNLVRLGELVEHEGSWFFSMELVLGVGLLNYVHGHNRLPDGGPIELDTEADVATSDTPADLKRPLSDGDDDPNTLDTPAEAIRRSRNFATKVSVSQRASTADVDGSAQQIDQSAHGDTEPATTDLPVRFETEPDGLDSSESPKVPQGEAPGAEKPLQPPQLRAPSLQRAAAQRPPVDLQRLRSVFAQLCKGLMALHKAQKVHRDIKPSNIMVTFDGRVVILDFGIVSDAEFRASWNKEQAIGTAAYMAPEQAAGQQVTPAADWYSVGVTLYQCLSGQLPFAGLPHEIIDAKHKFLPPPLQSVAPDVPEDLAHLCMRLLCADPTKRATGSDILEIVEPKPMIPRAAPATAPVDIFGRTRELTALRDAFSDVQQHQHAISVLVHGESGIGKSFLIRSFVKELEGQANVLVFSGRCYERESVPYKAVDRIIDHLSGYLQAIPPADAQSLLPDNFALLSKVFRVLETSVVFSQKSQQGPEIRDPVELRIRAFTALRELLCNIARRRPLVLVIDDLQWADTDSYVLLSEVLRTPEPPPLLLLATVRSFTAKQSSAAPGSPAGPKLPGQKGEVPFLPGDIRHMYLESLGGADAQNLVLQLLGTAAADADQVQAARLIAEEARGHPLFIDELVRQQLASGHRQASLRLDDALWSRISCLAPATRRILEVIAVAGVPCEQAAVARAGGIEPGELSTVLAQLRGDQLVRTSGLRLSDTVEPYHDRVRESVFAHIVQSARADWHGRLALALEGGGKVDPELLSIHWEGAGRNERAAEYAMQAADQAAAALAFDQAAQHYKRVLALQEASWDGRLQVLVKMGDALANAGRSAEAAPIFFEAAKGASHEKSLRLQIQATEQYFRSGHIDEGVSLLKTLLTAQGLYMPDTAWKTVAILLFRRMQQWWRGLRFEVRAPNQIPPEELLRVDTCHAASVGLVGSDMMRGAEFQARYCLMALKAGEPTRIAYALSLRATLLSFGGGPNRDKALAAVKTLEDLAGQVKDPRLEALAVFCRGSWHYCLGEWRIGRKLCDDAIEQLKANCVGIAWEVASAQRPSTSADVHLGEFLHLARRLPLMIEEAKLRGDLYTATNLRVESLPWLYLSQDDPVEAQRVVTEGLSKWYQGTSHMQHVVGLLRTAEADLYMGQPEAAYQRLKTTLTTQARLLLRVFQAVRILVADLEGRTALALAAKDHVARTGLLRDAAVAAKRIAAEKMFWSDPMALRIRAGLAALRGDTKQAIMLIDSAAMGFEKADMSVHAASSRRRQGQMMGADTGRALIAQAEQTLQTNGIRDVARWSAMQAPGMAPYGQ